ncbi:MAG: hypothetical protein Q7S80_00265, partial [bacterium]|nr:hypothetical protein [bacterium]
MGFNQELHGETEPAELRADEPVHEADVEAEHQPKYQLMITRHFERVPSGQLSQVGIAHAKEKGERMAGSAEVLAARVSDHRSGRAKQTGELITASAQIKSPLTDKTYGTREVPGIQYDYLQPDMGDVVPNGKKIVERATLQELMRIEPDQGWTDEEDENGRLRINIEKLPLDVMERIAPIRQKYQPLAFEYLMNNEPACHRLAIGLAHQLQHELEAIRHYNDMRQRHEAPLQKDVIINAVTHGMYIEALLKEAGFMVGTGGEAEKLSNFEISEFGGYIMPGE